MKAKKISIILGIFVSSLMLMQSVLAATGPPYIWAAQATLSTIDSNPSQDPENSGFGTLQVTVWEEWNGADWDIYMITSNMDGAPGTWVFPPLHPATTGQNEINPAVTVTRLHPATGQEIHVIYQRWNPNMGGYWEICHTYTNNLGGAWIGPIVLSTVGVSSTNPACVYTEDQNNPGGIIGFLCQIVWEEALPVGGNQIMYDAFVYDPMWGARGTVGPVIIRTPPPGCSSELPEIASVDERVSPLSYDFYFSIVWQETNAAGNWNIWYVDGTTTTTTVPPPPPPATVVLTPGSLGVLNIVAGGNDYTDPDIAASQDYQPLWVAQSYFFHVDFVWQRPGGGASLFDIMYCWAYGAVSTPGSAAFLFPPGSVYSVGPAAAPLVDNPTIATKLTSPFGALPITFETWFSWEDNTAAATTDIWYRVGSYSTGPPPGFVFTMPFALRVPYVPNPGVSTDQNPELWNREDALRLNPPVTHLVFDRNPHPTGVTVEIEYIDP